MTDLTSAVQNQANNLHTAIDMVLDKSSELHKERQRAEQLYTMCENLWQTLNAIRMNMPLQLGSENCAIIANTLKDNNPSKLKAND